MAISPKGRLGNAYGVLGERLTGLGFIVDTHVIPMSPEGWWFAGGRSYDEDRTLTHELVRVTVGWLKRILGPVSVS